MYGLKPVPFSGLGAGCVNAARSGESVPRGLKPPALLGICGTAKAVPLLQCPGIDTLASFSAAWEALPFQGTFRPGLKPGFVGMGFAGVETPASLRVRHCAGDKSPAYQFRLAAGYQSRPAAGCLDGVVAWVEVSQAFRHGGRDMGHPTRAIPGPQTRGT